MKLVMVVPDGLGDWRYPAIGNLSPVEAAYTPGLDKIVQTGQVGLVRTMYPGLPLGSLVGFLGIFGYNPQLYFPLGRSIFEAAALGLELGPQDMVFRCNIVAVNHADRLVDFTAKQISNAQALEYLAEVQLAPGFEIYHDLSYRNVLIYRNTPLAAPDFYLHEPHENVENDFKKLLPHYKGQVFSPLAEFMLASKQNNLMLWPWGADKRRTFPQTPYRIHVVTALSFLGGMMKLLGGQATIPPGATGYLGSDLGAKFTALTQHLPEVDIALIHCNAPDEEAHIHNVVGKTQSIADIDRLVISPLLDYLDNHGEPYRILVCPDHYTCCGDGKHHDYPVPFAVAGHGLQPNHTLAAYSEVAITDHIKRAGINSYQLISTFWQD